MKVVAYARVSSKEQAEMDLSVPAQLKAIRKHCREKGWDLVGEYVDEGKSAKTTDRPGFQRMVALARKANRHFDTIVVHKFDRFSRSRDDHVIYKALLKRHGVSVFSVMEQTDPDTPHGFLLEGMLEVISEFYNMNLASETRKGMVENARRGFHNGGNAPYGYRNHRFEHNGVIKSTWVLGTPEEVEIVRRIFEMYATEGLGYKRIASQLNKEGVAAPTDKGWSYTTIWHMLHNEAYIGTRIWNRQDYSTPGKKYKPESEWIRVEKIHPAIISKETYELVREARQKRQDVYPGFRTGNSPYLLRGLLFCPLCRGKMVSGQSGNKKGDNTHVRKYYVCGNYQRKGRHVCEFKSYPKNLLENRVIEVVARELLIFSVPGSLEEAVALQLESKPEGVDKKHMEQEIATKRRSLELLRGDVSILSSEAMQQHLAALADELETLLERQRLTKTTELLASLDEELYKEIRKSLRDHAEQLAWATPEIKREILNTYITRIDINTSKETMTGSFIVPHPRLVAPIIDKTLIISISDD